MVETETKIHALLHKISDQQKLQNYDIILSPISSGGQNYTSFLFGATITSKNCEDLQLFIKVAAVGDKARNGLKIYEVENFIYTELQEKFRKLEDRYGLVEKDRLNMSKYYGANTVPLNEMIVLENLTRRGFTSHDRMKSVDWEYAAAATRELAKLHALSMALEHENPEEFSKLLRYFQLDVLNLEGMEEYFDTSKKTALKAVHAENFEKLKKFLETWDFASLYNPGNPKREVLIHGDYRTSNMLHRVRDDGSVEVIPVDYQTLRGGCFVVDLLYFIFSGTDQQFRAQYYKQLVDYYYTELRAALTRLGLNPDKKYSREDFDEELKEKLLFGLGAAVFTLPIMTIEAENAPEVHDDMDLNSLSSAKTSSLYPERLNGVVDDFVRWGVL